MVGAWLLLGQRTKLLGVAILLPIMTNIIVFDLIFLDKLGALASALVYTAMLVYIVYFNRATVRRAIAVLTAGRANSLHRRRLPRQIAAVGILALIIFCIDQLILDWLGR